MARSSSPSLVLLSIGLLYLTATWLVHADVLSEFDDLDEDEFVGIPVETPRKKASESAPKPKSPAATTSTKKNSWEEGWLMEIAFGSFLVLYLLNFFSGRRTNEVYARAWALEFQKLFASNFHLLGEGEGKALLTKDSMSNYRFYATGRVHCDSLSGTIDLKKRHDLMMTLYNLSAPVDDLLTVDINMSEGCMEPFVWAVVNQSAEKAYKENNGDINTFCDRVNSPLDKQWVVLSDSPEMSSVILSAEVISTLKTYSQHLVSIHCSDSFNDKHKTKLQFVFRLPEPSDMKKISTVMKMMIHLIDVIGSHKLSAQGKLRAEKKRAEVEEKAFKAGHNQRQQAIADKKEREKIKEKEKVESMTPEQQRAWEVKQAKKRKKTSGPAFKMMKM